MSEINEDEEYLLDEITGATSKKKPVMRILNKGKLNKYEMDELFLGEE